MDGPSAVLDVGSNTIRLLVARVEAGNVRPVLDDSDFVRLGHGVDHTGELAADRMEAGLAAIRRLTALARENGASTILAFATSAVRDAANGPTFVRRVREETGVDLEIISGDREAELTFRGAAIGIDLRGGAIVCDLGGGSAELIHADNTGIRWRSSQPLGSGRLTERFVYHDPPTGSELERTAEHVVSVLSDLPRARVRSTVFTGGTAAHVARLAGSDDPATHLDLDALERVRRLLLSRPAQDISSTYRFQLERARVLPAGTAALESIAQYYQPDTVVITRNGIREGALLASAASDP